MQNRIERLMEFVVDPYRNCENVEPENHQEMIAKLIPSAAAVVNMVNAIPDEPGEKRFDELIISTRMILDAMEGDTSAAFACALSRILTSPLMIINEILNQLQVPETPVDPTGERFEGLTLEFIGSYEDLPPDIKEVVDKNDPLKPQEGEQN